MGLSCLCGTLSENLEHKREKLLLPFVEDEEFAEDVICHHDQDLCEELGNEVVDVQPLDQDNHRTHVDKE
mgnify:CR=1 FL=1